jgi:hypothetical protein
MSKDISKKVIDIFSRHKKELPQQEAEQVKFYAGFNYVRLERDGNGNTFNAAHLEKYAQSCNYIVRVMRQVNGETVLYSYDVPNEDLFKFIKSFEENTLDGKIIEIDKYFPEGLA